MEEKIKCSYCKEEINKAATVCPHCKKDIRNWFVKHWIISFLLVSFVLGTFMQGFEDGYNEKMASDNIIKESNIIDRCLDIPKELIKDIEGGLNGGKKLISVKGVKSNDFEKRYFISGFLEGEGINNNDIIVTFTVSDLDNGKTMIGSVGNLTKDNAVWPIPRIINNFNDGIKQSKECIKK